MKFWVFGFALSLVFLGEFALSRSILDSTGERVPHQKKPERIVTLAPSLAELVHFISPSDLKRIVGVSDYSDFPPELSQQKKIISIGNYAKINLEKVLSLKPDLVLATKDGNISDQVLRLRELGLNVVIISTRTVQEIEESISIIAHALGEAKGGQSVLRELRNGIAKIRAANRLKAKPQIMLQVGSDPLVVVGKKSFLNEVIEIVGGENSYGNLDLLYPRPSMEDVIKRNPDFIIVLKLGKDPRYSLQAQREWKKFKSLKAVQNRRVKILEGDTIIRPSLRLLDGLALLQKTIQPDWEKNESP